VGIYQPDASVSDARCASGISANLTALGWASGQPWHSPDAPQSCAFRGQDGLLHSTPCLAIRRCLCEWPASVSADYGVRVAAFEAAERASLNRLESPYLAGLATIAVLPSFLVVLYLIGISASRTLHAAKQRRGEKRGAEGPLASPLKRAGGGTGGESTAPRRTHSQRGVSLEASLEPPVTDPREQAVARAVETMRRAGAASRVNRIRVSVPAACLGLALHVVGLTPYVLPQWPTTPGGMAARIGQPLYVLTPLTPSVIFVLLALLPTDRVAIRCLAAFIVFLLLGLTPPFVLGAVQASSQPTVSKALGEGAIGCWANVAMNAIGILALARVALAPEARLPARQALCRLFAVTRLLLIANGCIVALELCVDLTTNPVVASASDPRRVAQGLEAISFLCAGLLATDGCRRRFHACLLRGDHERRAAALIAAMVGHSDLQAALEQAQDRFTMLPFERLRESDLQSAADTGLHQFAMPAVLGEVDCFVSHSWHDDGARKMAALRSWAARFEAEHGRPPTIWLDKGSIDQNRVAADLAGLPIYLLGCRSLVVLLGRTYCERLWCVMELFAFLQMGGKRENVHVIRLQSRCSITNLADWKIGASLCTVEADKQRLLGVIEAAFGDHNEFNKIIREICSESACTCCDPSEGHPCVCKRGVGNGVVGAFGHFATPENSIGSSSGGGGFPAPGRGLSGRLSQSLSWIGRHTRRSSDGAAISAAV